MESIKKSLIIGMGIGQLYKQVLTELGFTVHTVDMDLNKGADFRYIANAIQNLINPDEPPQQFDTIHICTPNWTHESIAMQVAPYGKIVFIEKPGVRNEEHLNTLHRMHPDTRFMMVKNNMWRDNIEIMREEAEKSESIHLNWINYNRIPGPGTWFTNKELAFGGVSRDLMPHLLSLVVALYPDRYKELKLMANSKERTWELAQLDSTDYGIINVNGVYDVDDMANMTFYLYSKDNVPEKYIMLESDWRTMEDDEKSVIFDYKSRNVRFELGLCPEQAYREMIRDCFEHLDDVPFWRNQYEIDRWIHRMVGEI